MEDVFPIISVSREIGQLVDDVAVDYPALVAYMRENGFGDKEILETSIEISSEIISKEYKNEPGKVYTTYGRYLKKDETSIISLYPAEPLREACARKDDEVFGGNKGSEQGVSTYFSETLVHELKHHAIRTLEGGMARETLVYAVGRLGVKAATVGMGVLAVAAAAYRTIEQLFPSMPIDRPEVHVGIVALAFSSGIKSADKITEEYDYYYASPEEARCREAEQYAPDNLVQFRLKDSHPHPSR